MCQRAVIAMALASEPPFSSRTSPPPGWTPRSSPKSWGCWPSSKRSFGIATLLISHDIRAISRLADNVAVMYGGTVVEHGPAPDVLASRFAPKHPYTTALLASIPSVQNVRDKGYLTVVEGEVPDAVDLPRGCRFYARCNRVTDDIRDKCAHHEARVAGGHAGTSRALLAVRRVSLAQGPMSRTILEVMNLKKYYRQRAGVLSAVRWREQFIPAVDG